jgi:2,4-dienoyl-CoA reductase-like NADH-dependent reductase (Old Yellow Enzyme family)
MSQFTQLQQPLKLGNLTLKNRVFMASLTRNRGVIPHEVNTDYYSQRAGSGIIFTEGILIEPQGTEWPYTPGLWSKKQVEGWKNVTDAVHAKGGVIFAQLWHLGRAAHTLHNQGIPPPAPSAIPAKGGKFRLLKGEPGYSIPEPIEDPKHYVQLFKKAAENAKLAGFDGVEIHASNGYLPHQFLESHSNIRTDEYGGSIENRSRFILEIFEALKEVYPTKQIGIKLSPSGGANDMGEDSIEKVTKLYSYIIKELDSKYIGYFQLTRYVPYLDTDNRGTETDIQVFRPLIKNALLIANLEFNAEDGNNYVAEGKADAISYGRSFITNPDLPQRFFNGIPINQEIDYSTYIIILRVSLN